MSTKTSCTYIAFDSCMCVPCQSPTQALDINLIESPFTWRCTYTSASASIQVNILCVHKQALCLCTLTTMDIASMDMYIHVSICAFDPSNNAWVHVNRQHYASSTTTSMCAYMSALDSSSCVHRQQPVRLSTFTTKSVLRACLHVRTFLHCLRSLHVRTCQSSTQSLCGDDNNLYISCHNSHRL